MRYRFVKTIAKKTTILSQGQNNRNFHGQSVAKSCHPQSPPCSHGPASLVMSCCLGPHCMTIRAELCGFNQLQPLCGRQKSHTIAMADKMHTQADGLAESSTLTKHEIVPLAQRPAVREQQGGGRPGHMGFIGINQEGVAAAQYLRKVCLKYHTLQPIPSPMHQTDAVISFCVLCSCRFRECCSATPLLCYSRNDVCFCSAESIEARFLVLQIFHKHTWRYTTSPCFPWSE